MAYTITAEKMVTGGDCISQIEGKKIFVPYAIPGEKLEVEITKDFRDYSCAKIINILEPSVHRVKPFCPLYEKCGGCNMQHIDNDYQKELRKSILKDTFERENISIPEIQVISGDNKGYRARFQLHDGGLMEKQSNSIIQIDNCPCATPEVNKYLSEVESAQRPKDRVHIFGCKEICSIPEGYDKIIIANEIKRQEKKKQQENRQRRTATGRLLKKQKPIKARFEGTTFNPENLCTVSINGKKITFDVQGFFQSNIGLLEKVIPFVTEGLEGKNALDMYSGAGTFSVFLSDVFENVCLVEHNKDAIAFAEQNLSQKKHESYGVSGDVWTKYHAETFIQRCGNFDAVVIDPPRSGMEASVCKFLCDSNIPKIRAVSCDAATQARDIAKLLKAGYKLEKLFLLDFYPQTCHIESLAWLSK